MTDASPLAELKPEPYWWEKVPRPNLPNVTLPRRVDVAVIGSGYTGLSAALALARAGRDVLVFDAEAAGWGASSRNQGQIGLFTRSSFADLEKRYGRARATALIREGLAAVEFVIDLIEREKIDCYLRKTGRFIAAPLHSSYEALAKEGEAIKREIGFESEMVSRDEMLKRELVSDAYVGGQVRLGEACLHGAMFHSGLLARTMDAGVRVAAETRVTNIVRQKDGFEVHSAGGTLVAKDVIVATDALTGTLVPYLARRVIPVSAGGIATEPLSPERVRSVIPGLRPCVDTWKIGNSIRPSPDQTRLIFGGRRTMLDSDAHTSGRRLYAKMVELFPQLGGVRITHSWLGKVGYTFQTMPHTGTIDGMHYATGYCGYGVAVASYLGRKVALRILRANDAVTAYDDLPFKTRPLYYGKPWFLPASLLWYRLLDYRKGKAGRS
ncbi:MAG: NAD(P)/FAD-dependent oxidoreductase [Alphaproteobacteria bacterium]